MSSPTQGSRIVWLASYPKSGNTWFRIFLANYLENREQPVSINGLGGCKVPMHSMASGRHLFGDVLGFDAGDFSHQEYECLRPDVYRALASQAAEPLYMKVHDANLAASSGEPLIPPEATARAIYFVRNPLDIAVSFANHSGWSIDETIGHMSNPDFAFCSAIRGLPTQLRQRLLTWSGHVASWTDAPAFPVHVLRYEDMLAQPVETFGGAARALGFVEDLPRLSRSIEFSSFRELRGQEEKEGFREAPPNVERFFRRGCTGDWRDALSQDQVQCVIDVHGEVMRRFRYIDAAGEPTG